MKTGVTLILEARGDKLIFTRVHISLAVAFKGLNVILGLYKCNYPLTIKRELGITTGWKQGGGPDSALRPCVCHLCYKTLLSYKQLRAKEEEKYPSDHGFDLRSLSGQNLRGKMDFGEYEIREPSQGPLCGELMRPRSEQ